MDVVGIEIGIGVVGAIAIAWVVFIVHVKLLEREVRRTLATRRMQLAAYRPVAASPRPISLEGLRAQYIRADGRGRVEDQEIARIIAEAEDIAARGEALSTRAS